MILYFHTFKSNHEHYAVIYHNDLVCLIPFWNMIVTSRMDTYRSMHCCHTLYDVDTLSQNTTTEKYHIPTYPRIRTQHKRSSSTSSVRSLPMRIQLDVHIHSYYNSLRNHHHTKHPKKQQKPLQDMSILIYNNIHHISHHWHHHTHHGSHYHTHQYTHHHRSPILSRKAHHQADRAIHDIRITHWNAFCYHRQHTSSSDNNHHTRNHTIHTGRSYHHTRKTKRTTHHRRTDPPGRKHLWPQIHTTNIYHATIMKHTTQRNRHTIYAWYICTYYYIQWHTSIYTPIHQWTTHNMISSHITTSHYSAHTLLYKKQNTIQTTTTKDYSHHSDQHQRSPQHRPSLQSRQNQHTHSNHHTKHAQHNDRAIPTTTQTTHTTLTLSIHSKHYHHSYQLHSSLHIPQYTITTNGTHHSNHLSINTSNYHTLYQQTIKKSPHNEGDFL